MPFKLAFTELANATLDELATDPASAAKLRKVRKALGLLSRDPRHPGLNSHEYHSMAGRDGTKLWESYVENRTPRAWRIWWSYGPDRQELTVMAIGPHPD